MNVFAKFDEIPSMILQDIKETKRYGHTVGRTDGRMAGRTFGQPENSIPSHKHSLRGYKKCDASTEAHTLQKQYAPPTFSKLGA